MAQSHYRIVNFLDPRYCSLLRSNRILSNGVVGITNTLKVEAKKTPHLESMVDDAIAESCTTMVNGSRI